VREEKEDGAWRYVGGKWLQFHSQQRVDYVAKFAFPSVITFKLFSCAGYQGCQDCHRLILTGGALLRTGS
jgi:hypothetical protein